MKKRTVFYALCASIILFIMACSKEFDSTAPYQDVTIVYGIINSNDNTHYIKIYRGFLTDGDAYAVASEYDSLYYFGKIKVELLEYTNGKVTGTFQLDTTTSISRESGDFASPKQLLYYLTQPLRDDSQYLLRITNKETGRVGTAQTSIVGDFTVNAPATHQLNITNGTSNPIRYSEAPNAVAYDIYQYFYYIERDKTTHVETEKVIKRKINSEPIKGLETSYVPNTIYTAIASHVQANNNVERFLKGDSCIRFEIWAVNEDLYNYVKVSTPSSSVVMDRLQYTNVKAEDNLVAGIFASRKKAESWHAINTQSQDSIVRGSKTRNLGFHYFHEM